MSRTRFVLLLLASALLLGVATVYAQVDHLGLHFIRVQQARVHDQMLHGTAGDPWQYRILADLMLEQGIRLASVMGLPEPDTSLFIAFRFFQVVVILITAGVYYSKLGLQPTANLIGISILAWGMSNSLYNSDLSFNVYFDVLFYLLAAILILGRSNIWLVLLMLPAALNRETSMLIPLMLVASVYFDRARRSGLRAAAVSAAAALAVFAVVAAALRVHYGPQQFLMADGYFPGFELLLLNLRRAATWEQLLITLGIVPALALLAYARWPHVLRVFFWTVVPAWVSVHFVAALVAETRLMLVPQALIFIPGALFGVSAAEKPREVATPSTGPTAPGGPPKPS